MIFARSKQTRVVEIRNRALGNEGGFAPEERLDAELLIRVGAPTHDVVIGASPASMKSTECEILEFTPAALARGTSFRCFPCTAGQTRITAYVCRRRDERNGKRTQHGSRFQKVPRTPRLGSAKRSESSN